MFCFLPTNNLECLDVNGTAEYRFVRITWIFAVMTCVPRVRSATSLFVNVVSRHVLSLPAPGSVSAQRLPLRACGDTNQWGAIDEGVGTTVGAVSLQQHVLVAEMVPTWSFGTKAQ